MRVFVLGLPKTGLSSTLEACRILGFKKFGYRSQQPPLVAIAKHDHMAIGDLQFLAVWRKAVKRYPDARLVLTERSNDAWLRSICRWFGQRRTGFVLRRKVLGTGEPDREALLQAYNRHLSEVSCLDVLRFRPTENDGWEPLCTFLGAPIPAEPFPHRNKTFW